MSTATQQSKKSPQEFAEQVVKEADEYNGFNLVLVDVCNSSMVYVFNRPKPGYLSVTPGIHVLTNAALDAPWPKVTYTTELLLCNNCSTEKFTQPDCQVLVDLYN